MEKSKTNFSEEEIAVLLELVSRHRSVVESKKSDAVSVSRKRESWKKIEDEFNCHHNVMPRTWGPLKKCWENLKDKWRRCNAQDIRERFSTGSQDAADEPDDWFLDDAGRPPAEPETNAAPLPATTDSRALVHGTSQEAAVTEPSAAATSNAPVPAGTRRPTTSSSQRQTAVSLELSARLSAIKDDREKNDHFLKMKFMRLEHKYKSLHSYVKYCATMRSLILTPLDVSGNGGMPGGVGSAEGVGACESPLCIAWLCAGGGTGSQEVAEVV
ncbi:uncharacterized protein LOC125944288 [Dermacentor silvarum]|uniref:uncharacterized protein LOC125944288 n=1 Tax=Dermacentor silvarum TaxID=543639 RepID=UPI002100C018|nr:uncharacterized protein LOC125944288 [Dermacentor silvarum]